MKKKYLKIFISYNSVDKKLAGLLKKYFKRFGLTVFLAHEDIKPAVEWQKEIVKNLETMDVFIPILTNSFILSKWASQECGFALCRNILIISLKVDADPYGFLGKEQALTFKTNYPDLAVKNIIKLIHSRKELKPNFLNGIINFVSKSDSFDEAKERTKLLNLYNGYSKTQLKEILDIVSKNDQIYYSWGACRNLKSFISNYEDKMDSFLVNKVKQKLR